MKILIILLRHLGSLYPAFKLSCKCSCPILAILLTVVIKLYFHFRIMKTEVNLFLSTFSSTAQDPEQHSCRHHSPLAKRSELSKDSAFSGFPELQKKTLRFYPSCCTLSPCNTTTQTFIHTATTWKVACQACTGH